MIYQPSKFRENMQLQKCLPRAHTATNRFEIKIAHFEKKVPNFGFWIFSHYFSQCTGPQCSHLANTMVQGHLLYLCAI